ncbi:MAG TPA: ABC transporter substrate-binding protein, partial [Acidimicrobiia bacterium]|nr:ABC transporter substrate-binding protein [Acidimicrobiia bacterium]
MKVRKAAALLAALALVATGCSRGGDGGDATAAPGVTEEACPDAVNADNGCIYLGTISDLTQGPFAALGVAIVDSQKAFWKKVNEDGGIGGYDIDVTKYVKDNLYKPDTHAQVYSEIEGDVLALAQSLGSPTTLAILPDLKSDEMIAAPASWTSLWAFEDNILESGANYCVEGMNSVDYAVEEKSIKSVMAVHFPGDYGGDGAAGAKIAAEANGLDFSAVET